MELIFQIILTIFALVIFILGLFMVYRNKMIHKRGNILKGKIIDFEKVGDPDGSDLLNPIVEYIDPDEMMSYTKPSASFSISFFVVLGYKGKFNGPSSYLGKFTTIGFSGGGYKGYTAYGDECWTIGAGKYWPQDRPRMIMTKSKYRMIGDVSKLAYSLYDYLYKKVEDLID